MKRNRINVPVNLIGHGNMGNQETGSSQQKKGGPLAITIALDTTVATSVAQGNGHIAITVATNQTFA